MTKIKIPETKEEFSSVLEGNIEHAIAFLQLKQHQGWEKIGFDYDHEMSTIYLEFHRDRLETDKEYNKRMKELAKLKETNKKIKAGKIKSEMELYEKLKKKYEKV